MLKKSVTSPALRAIAANTCLATTRVRRRAYAARASRATRSSDAWSRRPQLFTRNSYPDAFLATRATISSAHGKRIDDVDQLCGVDGLDQIVIEAGLARAAAIVF